MNNFYLCALLFAPDPEQMVAQDEVLSNVFLVSAGGPDKNVQRLVRAATRASFSDHAVRADEVMAKKKTVFKLRPKYNLEEVESFVQALGDLCRSAEPIPHVFPGIILGTDFVFPRSTRTRSSYCLVRCTTPWFLIGVGNFAMSRLAGGAVLDGDAMDAGQPGGPHGTDARYRHARLNVGRERRGLSGTAPSDSVQTRVQVLTLVRTWNVVAEVPQLGSAPVVTEVVEHRRVEQILDQRESIRLVLQCLPLLLNSIFHFLKEKNDL